VAAFEVRPPSVVIVGDVVGAVPVSSDVGNSDSSDTEGESRPTVSGTETN
jgi:hypothetical protein